MSTQDSEQADQFTEETSHSPRPGNFAVWLTAALVLGVMLLGGGQTAVAKGIFLLGTGLLLLCRPPRRTADRRFDWVMLFMLFVAVLYFLPIGLLDVVANISRFVRAQWWNVAERLGVPLPNTVTSQPWLAAETLILLFGVWSFVYILWNFQFGRKLRKHLCWAIIAVGNVLGLTTFVARIADFSWVFHPDARAFTLFRNADLMGLTLAIISVLAVAVLLRGARKPFRTFLRSCLIVVPIGLGLVAIGDRLTITLALFGAALVSLNGANTHDARWFLRFPVTVGLLSLTAIACIAIITGYAFDLPLLGLSPQSGGLPTDEVISLTLSHLLIGVGPGSFESIAPLFRGWEAATAGLTSPYNGWLRLFAEFGVLGSAAVLMLCILLVFQFVYPGDRRSRWYRDASFFALTGAFFFSFHGAPFHVLGFVLFALLVYRLGISPRDRSVSCLFPRFLFRFGGLIFMVIGIIWVGSDLGLWRGTLESRRNDWLERSRQALADGRYEMAQQTYGEAARIDPLNWQIYSESATAELATRDLRDARADFGRAAFLEPHLAKVTLIEGEMWLDHDVNLTMNAWRKTLGSRVTNETEALFENIVDAGQAHRRFRENLRRLTLEFPDLRFFFLVNLAGDPLTNELLADIRNDAKLERFSKGQRQLLLLHWAESGRPQEFLRYLDEYPEIVEAPWAYRAFALGRMGQYEEAMEILSQNLASPRDRVAGILSKLETAELEEMIGDEENAQYAANALFLRYLESGNTASAMNLAERLAGSENPPAYALFWHGETLRRRDRHEEAFSLWQQYVRDLLITEFNLEYPVEQS